MFEQMLGFAWPYGMKDDERISINKTYQEKKFFFWPMFVLHVVLGGTYVAACCSIFGSVPVYVLLTHKFHAKMVHILLVFEHVYVWAMLRPFRVSLCRPWGVL